MDGSARPLSTMLMKAAVNAPFATLACVMRRSSRSPRRWDPIRRRTSASTPIVLRCAFARRPRAIEERG